MQGLVSGQTLTCHLNGRCSFDREVGGCVMPEWHISGLRVNPRKYARVVALTPTLVPKLPNAMLRCNICIARLLCSRSITPTFCNRDWFYLLPELIDSNRRHPPPPGCRLYYVSRTGERANPPDPALPSAHLENRSVRAKHLPTLAGGGRQDLA